MRRRHSAEFKAKVVLDLLQGGKITEIAREHQLDPKMIRDWKNTALESMKQGFKGKASNKQQDNLEKQLFEEIGRLKFELDWLKKKDSGSG